MPWLCCETGWSATLLVSRVNLISSPTFVISCQLSQDATDNNEGLLQPFWPELSASAWNPKPPRPRPGKNVKARVEATTLLLVATCCHPHSVIFSCLICYCWYIWPAIRRREWENSVAAEFVISYQNYTVSQKNAPTLKRSGSKL